MKAAVLDASVIVKWLPPIGNELLADRARVLLFQWMNAELELAVPDVMAAEVANVLWKGVRQHRCTAEQAKTSIRLLLAHKLRVFRCEDVLQDALDIAVEQRRTVYDSIYVALARELRTDLITADEKLANALAGRFPVRWLGSL